MLTNTGFNNKQLLQCGVVVLSLWLHPSVSAAVTYQVTQIKAGDILNMRAEPNTSASVKVRIPADASGIELTGATKKVASQTWVEARWQGKTGWVNRRYLTSASTASDKTDAKTSDTKATNVDTNQDALKKTFEDPSIQKTRQTGMWILECSGRSPRWKMDVLPQWLSGSIDGAKIGMPITAKHQEHGKYHRVALKTEVRGANQWSKLVLTLRYTKTCRSISGRLVAFSVEGSFNKYTLSGCCRALKVN
ncbi:SH3 domain-containing protein [Thiolinea disciformis]|uniref:SH3 domain-containing protein n=1 Tax=Thiolinea disciformis TaxID=125614 RepID=UPI00036F55BF|nr:SH3 domain-containing protein [Thiolinea disciformis]